MAAGSTSRPVEGLDIVLRDGSTVHVRPADAGDVAAVRAFLEDLSEESRWFRFFSAGIDFQRAAETAVDPREGLSLSS